MWGRLKYQWGMGVRKIEVSVEGVGVRKIEVSVGDGGEEG